MRTPKWLILVLAAALVFTGACGDDESTDESGDQDATATAGGEDADTGDDQALADSVVLTLEDFPAGWTEGEDDDDADGEEGEEEDDPIDQCFGEEGEELEDATTGEGESPDFSRGQVTQASSFSVVLETADDAEKGFDLLAGDTFEECVQEEMERTLAEEAGEEATFGEISTKRASFPRTGDQTVAYQIVIPVEVEGEEAVFYTEFVFFREGRVIGGAFFLNLSEPLDAEVERDLVKAMADRAAA